MLGASLAAEAQQTNLPVEQPMENSFRQANKQPDPLQEASPRAPT